MKKRAGVTDMTSVRFAISFGFKFPDGSRSVVQDFGRFYVQRCQAPDIQTV